MSKDSLIYEVMNGNVGEAEYRSSQSVIWKRLITNYFPLDAQNEGFLDLMSLQKQQSSELDSLIPELKSLYLNDLKSVELSNNILRNLSIKHLDWLKYNAPWSSEAYFNKHSISRGIRLLSQ